MKESIKEFEEGVAKGYSDVANRIQAARILKLLTSDLSRKPTDEEILKHCNAICERMKKLNKGQSLY